jgi:hypothetical protein
MINALQNYCLVKSDLIRETTKTITEQIGQKLSQLLLKEKNLRSLRNDGNYKVKEMQ